jgi:hypothetical protein
MVAATLLQRLAAALTHGTLLLHESLLPNRQVGAVGREMNRSQVAHLFGVSLSSVKRYATMVLPPSTEGKDNRGVHMTKIVLLHRTNLPCSVKTRPRRIRT